MTIDRATKVAVLCWTAAALALQTWLTPGWRDLQAINAAVFAAAALLAIVDPRSVFAVLALTYVFPTIINVWRGSYYASFDVIWMTALFGAIMPQALRTSWHLPARWRAPLVAWTLVVALGAVIVACREIDFNVALLLNSRMPSEALGGVPRFTVGWVLQVAIILVLGILWFDWLFGATAIDFRQVVVAPLALSALVMFAAAIYQLFVDVTWLNQTVYGGLGRASGTLLDGNVMGTLAALWVGGLTLYARAMTRLRWIVLGAAVPAAWLSVWASGSRTAFAAAVVVTGFVLFDLVSRAEPAERPKWRSLSVIFALSIGALLVASLSGVGKGPVDRFRTLLDKGGSVSGVAAELWNRNGYGRHATEMISEYPLFGVGVGSFNGLVSDYAERSGDSATADNAQNWYRHQLAEFGSVGSIAWGAWVISFAAFVLRRHPAGAPGLMTARGMLVAFAAISLVGMPGQLIAVVITFWTLAYWFVRLAGDPMPAAPPRGKTWALIAALCVVYAAGTLHVATSELRVPLRAARMDRPYSYGFYFPEPDGAGGVQRWARQRAAIVLDAPTQSLDVTIGVNHVDVTTNPVEAKVWIDRRLVVDTTLNSTAPVTRHVVVSKGHKKILLETWVSRVVRPRDFKVVDDRELGLLVKWNFADQGEAF